VFPASVNRKNLRLSEGKVHRTRSTAPLYSPAHLGHRTGPPPFYRPETQRWLLFQKNEKNASVFQTHQTGSRCLKRRRETVTCSKKTSLPFSVLEREECVISRGFL
jgi:hypothetical protein